MGGKSKKGTQDDIAVKEDVSTCTQQIPVSSGVTAAYETWIDGRETCAYSCDIHR
jgi:hypothetical protein